MNLVIQKLTEINDALERFKKGDMNVEQVQAFVSLTNAAHKWANMALQAYAIESKNKRVMKSLGKMNIMDDETAIEIGILAEDKIKCELSNKLISRHECLDLSGDPPEGTDCSGCEHFATTRHMLVDGNE